MIIESRVQKFKSSLSKLSRQSAVKDPRTTRPKTKVNQRCFKPLSQAFTILRNETKRNETRRDTANIFCLKVKVIFTRILE